jgi:DNA invertase Pin-like site-specific DNA recombinase
VNGKYVSYIRVSTQKQGRSGLGLAAQRDAITTYLNGGNWKLIDEVQEVESGKNSDRPKLAEALGLCRLHRATLLIAKLDRLARNVSFVANLMESGVKFVAVDMPFANELTIHVMAAMAEYEAKAISKRTRDALRAAKKRGVKKDGSKLVLGGRKVSRERWGHIAAKGRALGTARRSEMASAWAADVLPIIKDIKRSGAASLREIAAALNSREVPTRRGEGEWTATQIARVLALAQS